jgi:hypothetical protein
MPFLLMIIIIHFDGPLVVVVPRPELAVHILLAGGHRAQCDANAAGADEHRQRGQRERDPAPAHAVEAYLLRRALLLRDALRAAAPGGAAQGEVTREQRAQRTARGRGWRRHVRYRREGGVRVHASRVRCQRGEFVREEVAEDAVGEGGRGEEEDVGGEEDVGRRRASNASGMSAKGSLEEKWTYRLR